MSDVLYKDARASWQLVQWKSCGCKVLQWRQHLHHVLKLVWWKSCVWQLSIDECTALHMWMKGLLKDWFNEWTVFDNSALMNVSQYACRWKVCSGIGLMNRQCLTTQLCECAVILIQMKEPLKNWSDERTVLKIKELCLTT